MLHCTGITLQLKRVLSVGLYQTEKSINADPEKNNLFSVIDFLYPIYGPSF
jgi:hypothetical protein